MPFKLLPTIVIDSMVRIPKVLLDNLEEEKRSLKIFNTAKMLANKRGFGTKDGTPDHFLLYEETATHLIVPRAHQPKLKPELRRDKDYKIRVDAVYNNGSVDFREDNVSLGPNEHQPWDQQQAFDALIAPNKWPYGRSLVLRCGAGKTAIALKGAFHRQAKTLWVTVNTGLLEQAKRDITRWLSIPPEEIGHVQAGKDRWKGTSIAVAMIHTLSAHDLSKEFCDYWDLVIFDEGDVLGAQHFAHVAGKFRGERWLLSATPKRADGMHVLFEKHIGKPCFTYLEYASKPEIFLVRSDADKSCIYRAGWDQTRGEPRVIFSVTAAKLMQFKSRMDLLTKQVALATEKGRTCLILGDSVNGLMGAYLSAKDALPGKKVGLVIGKVKQKDRDRIIQENDVVFATGSLARRGLDRPSFDTLILATIVTANATNLEQAAGRILRLQADKSAPLIVVIVDPDCAPMAMLQARLVDVFRKKGWKVHNAELVLRVRAEKRMAERMQKEDNRYDQ